MELTRVVAGANDHRRRARHNAPARRPRIDLSRKFVGHARIDFHFLARVGAACAEELDHRGPSAESAALQLSPGVDGQIGACNGLRCQGQRASRGKDQEKHGGSKGRPHRKRCAQNGPGWTTRKSEVGSTPTACQLANWWRTCGFSVSVPAVMRPLGRQPPLSVTLRA